MVNRTEGLDYSVGQGFSTLDAKAARDARDGYAVASGLEVTTDGLDLTLDVSSGSATVGQTSGSVDTVSLGTAGTVTLAAADTTHPRKDTIYIDSTGTLVAETGVAEAADPSGNVRFNTFQPEPPYPGTEGTILAEVWVASGASSIASADVRDRRVPSDWVGDSVVASSVGADELQSGNLTATIRAFIASTGNVVATDPDSVVANNSDPDTALNNAVAAMPATGGVLLARVGEYGPLSSPISWSQDGIAFTGEMMGPGAGGFFRTESSLGAKLDTGANDTTAISVNSAAAAASDKITTEIKDWYIYGPGASSSTNPGVLANGMDQSQFKHLNIQEFDQGFYADFKWNACYLSEFFIGGTTKDAIYIDGGNDGEIYNGTIVDSGPAINYQNSLRPKITNVISQGTGTGVNFDTVDQGIVANNSFVSPGQGVRLAGSNLNTVHGNIIRDGSGNGVEIVTNSGGASSQRNTISANTISSMGLIGVSIAAGSQSTVVGNSIVENTRHGIKCSSPDSTISGNQILLNDSGNTGSYDGVVIDNNRIVVANNVIRGNGRYGINVTAGSTECIIANNIMGANTSGDINDNGTRTIINGRSQQAATPGSAVAGDEWGGNEATANRLGVVVEDTSVTAPYDFYRADSAGNWVQIG